MQKNLVQFRFYLDLLFMTLYCCFIFKYWNQYGIREPFLSQMKLFLL